MHHATPPRETLVCEGTADGRVLPIKFIEIGKLGNTLGRGQTITEAVTEGSPAFRRRHRRVACLLSGPILIPLTKSFNCTG